MSLTSWGQLASIIWKENRNTWLQSTGRIWQSCTCNCFIWRHSDPKEPTSITSFAFKLVPSYFTIIVLKWVIFNVYLNFVTMIVLYYSWYSFTYSFCICFSSMWNMKINSNSNVNFKCCRLLHQMKSAYQDHWLWLIEEMGSHIYLVAVIVLLNSVGARCGKFCDVLSSQSRNVTIRYFENILKEFKVVDPICSLKMWDWINIMVCRIKYNVGTLQN